MKFTASIGLDLACIVCAALSVATVSTLYAIIQGWIGL